MDLLINNDVEGCLLQAKKFKSTISDFPKFIAIVQRIDIQITNA